MIQRRGAEGQIYILDKSMKTLPVHLVSEDVLFSSLYHGPQISRIICGGISLLNLRNLWMFISFFYPQITSKQIWT
jgi:hypothetical protein